MPSVASKRSPAIEPFAFTPARFTRLGFYPLDSDYTVCKLVNVRDIAFIFRGSALGRNLVDAPWMKRHFFEHSGVYIRTMADGFFRAKPKTSVAALQAAVDPLKFIRVYPGVVVNWDRIEDFVDFTTNFKKVSFLIGGHTEYVRVSRSAARELEIRAGLRLPRAARRRRLVGE